MYTRMILSGGVLLMTLSSVAFAADHLVTAVDHGLSTDSQGYISGAPAPGQGNPFIGEDTGIPATDTAAAAHGQALPDSATGAPGHNK